MASANNTLSETIIQLYLSGLSLRATGKMVGVSDTTVARRLKSAGIARRPASKPKKPGCRDKRYRERLKKEKPEKHADRMRYIWEHNLKSMYGISSSEYWAMMEAQNGVCAICGQTENGGKKLAVDHDHDTGAIRGLLCGACNKGLGHFQDSEKIMDAAIQYLQVAKCR